MEVLIWTEVFKTNMNASVWIECLDDLPTRVTLQTHTQGYKQPRWQQPISPHTKIGLTSHLKLRPLMEVVIWTEVRGQTDMK